MLVYVFFSVFVFFSIGIDVFIFVCVFIILFLFLSVLYIFVDIDRYWVGCRGFIWFRSGGYICEKDCILSYNCYLILIKRRKWKF